MTTRTASRFALGAWMTSMLLVGLALALPQIVARSTAEAAMYDYWRESIVNTLAYATVGMLIVMRRPAHRIGWLFSAIGLFSATQLISGQYATTSLAIGAYRLPGALIVAWISNLAQHLAVSSMVFMLLLFPTGYLPSHRWRLAAWMLGFGNGLWLIRDAIAPGPLDSFPNVENPFGIADISGALDLFGLLIVVLVLLGLAGAVASLMSRFRQARGIERQQLKWFVYIATVGIAALMCTQIDLISGILENLLWAAVPGGLPIAVAVAILRYQLYDIDILINRTLVYGALTASLALVYIGCVVVLQQILRPFTAGSELAIVASTLAIAALFNPLRRRIQAIIDQRFYRRKYDAAKVLAGFSKTVRDETNLDALTEEMLRVVDVTVQPALVGLWLRKPEHEVRQ
jgi:hypothetical protein